MFHDYDMTKEPIVELTSETYSSVRKLTLMLVICTFTMEFSCRFYIIMICCSMLSYNLIPFSEAESGFASDSDQAMLVVLLGQEDMVIDLTFTYQVLDDSSCRGLKNVSYI